MDILLFSQIEIASMNVKNRIFMSPMCQYSAQEGLINDWHKTHYISRAIGGVGAIIMEATAIEPNGRITPYDLGLWNDEQVDKFGHLIKEIKKYDCCVGIQLAHSGRKGSKDVPWRGEQPLDIDNGGWEIMAPSPIAFDKKSQTPRQMNAEDIEKIVELFQSAAKRAYETGFDFIELHMAHGYLLHEFLSPLSNKRTDDYGGCFENRCRLPLRIAEIVRKTIPKDMPLFVRISATDWIEGGWDIKQSVKFAKRLKKIGVNLVDVSSGGLVNTDIKYDYGFQSELSYKIKNEADISVGSVGMISNPYQAEHILASHQADIVILGRALLFNPYWAVHSAKTMNLKAELPNQYLRALH